MGQYPEQKVLVYVFSLKGTISESLIQNPHPNLELDHFENLAFCSIMSQFVLYEEKLIDKCTGTCGWSLKSTVVLRTVCSRKQFRRISKLD